MAILYKADPVRGAIWRQIFNDHLPEQPFHIWPDMPAPGDVDYLIAWTPPEQPLSGFPNLRAVFSVGAGVNQFDFGQIPPGVPLIRLIDPNTTASVAEYVATGVLALHRDLPAYVAQMATGTWAPHPVIAATERRIGFLGLGEMARAAIDLLRPFGFPIAGWSRSRHTIPGIACHAGDAELDSFLAGADILVCLLPLTEATRGFLNAQVLSCLPAGAALLQAGRGGQTVPADLIAALDSGRLRAAMLDVTDPEPLPPEDPLWRHPGIVLTPHVASQTRPDSAARIVLDNIRRLDRGLAPVGLVDLARGY